MPSPSTARRWQRRLAWPVILSTVWFVLYTSLVVFERTFADPGASATGFLFSSQHLSHPLGWLFLLALTFTLVGALFKIYMLLAGH